MLNFVIILKFNLFFRNHTPLRLGNEIMKNSLFRMFFSICLLVLLFSISYPYHPYLEHANEEILVSDNEFVSTNNINYVENEMVKKEADSK